MKFYNRENELALLDRIENRSVDTAQMTFVVGRRRIGKTSLIIKATEKQDMLYFFIAKGCKKVIDPTLDGGEKINLKIVTFDEFMQTTRDPRFMEKEIVRDVYEALLDEGKYKELKELFAPLK